MQKVNFLLFSSSRVDLFVKMQNCLNLSLILQFMQLATYERRVPDSLCSSLIRCRMQGRRTDYCKVRIEVLNLFPGENSAQNSWNPWVLPLFNIPNVMTPHFFDGRQTTISFANLNIIFFEDDYASLLGGLFRLRARS